MSDNPGTDGEENLAEDLSVDRILPPTPQRRQRARREGHVARSPRLTAAVVILCTLLALELVGPRMLASWRSCAEALLSSQKLSSVSAEGLGAELSGMVSDAAMNLLPLLLAVGAIAVMASLVQVGFLFAPRRLSLQMDAISPGKALSRIFCGRSLVAGAAGLFNLAAVAGVGWLAVRAEVPDLVMLQALPINEAVPAAGATFLTVGFKVALVLVASGLLDYTLARWRCEQHLRLTPIEAREEARQMDGDPQIRARQRQVARQRVVTPRNEARLVS